MRIPIGSAEYVSFPKWEIFRLRANVDTGANTSALHVENLRLSPSGKTASFNVIVDPLVPTHNRSVEAKVIRQSKIRSSNGQIEIRVVVATTMKIGETEKEVELSLTCRKAMRYRMLLGRRALGSDFSVYPDKRYLTKKKAKKKKKTASSKKAVSKKKRLRKTSEEE